MKNSLFLILAFFILSSSLKAQEVSYGLSLGSNYRDNEINAPFSGGDGQSLINVGAFVGVKLSDRLGMKGQLLYTPKSVEKYTLLSPFDSIQFETDNSQLFFQGLLKFDVAGEYNRGFYILGGPSLLLTLSSETDFVGGLPDFYNKQVLGASFGFGFHFLKHFAFEATGDYTLSNYSKLDNIEAQTFGIYGNFQIDIASLLK